MEGASKDLTHRQFLVNLQLEYLTHKLRSLIYQNETYASVAADIAEKKKKKIKELGKKFKEDTIFSSKIGAETFISQYFWQPYGLPNFQYKDDEQRRVQGNYDCWYMLYRSTKVTYRGVRGEVISNDPSRQEVKIRTEEGTYLLNYVEISLINNYELI